jgi:hypothetical protein
MSEREARTVLRRLAEGVAAAHRVGLAVGGLTPETVVLRPNGLVGLRSVPAASGTVQGDVAALGELLEYCLTGRRPGVAPAGRAAGMPPDLAALVRRARSTEPGAGLSSVAAMAALLAERPRTGHTADPVRDPDESDSGWLRRLRERREEDRAEHDGDGDVAVDPAPTRDASGTAYPPLEARGLPPVPGRRYEDDEDDLLPAVGRMSAARTTTPTRTRGTARTTGAAGCSSWASHCWRWPWSSRWRSTWQQDLGVRRRHRRQRPCPARRRAAPPRRGPPRPPTPRRPPSPARPSTTPSATASRRTPTSPAVLRRRPVDRLVDGDLRGVTGVRQTSRRGSASSRLG